MSHHNRLLFSLMLLPMIACAQFTPITDDFSTDGSLVGTTPDSGLGSWTRISGSSAPVVSNGSLTIATTGGEAAQLNFASSDLSTGTIYFGWDFTVSATGSLDTNGTIQAIAGFRSGTAASGSAALSFGVFRPSSSAQSFSGAPDTTTSQVVVGLFTGSSLNATNSDLSEWSVALDRGATYRAVLGFDLSNDSATLWINPSSSASTSVSLSSVTAGARGIFFRQGGSSHGTVSVDNVTVSQAFATAAVSASAIPEPAALPLLAGSLALGAALLHRDRGGRARV